MADEMRGYRKLGAAVLASAVREAWGQTAGAGRTRDWLCRGDRDPWLRYWCSLAGVSPSLVQGGASRASGVGLALAACATRAGLPAKYARRQLVPVRGVLAP